LLVKYWPSKKYQHTTVVLQQITAKNIKNTIKGKQSYECEPADTYRL